jgi:hypothetical protein
MRKSRLHRDSILGPSSPYPVAIPTELPGLKPIKSFLISQSELCLPTHCTFRGGLLLLITFSEPHTHTHTYTHKHTNTQSAGLLLRRDRPYPRVSTNIYAPGHIRTRNPCKRAVADQHIRPRGIVVTWLVQLASLRLVNAPRSSNWSHIITVHCGNCLKKRPHANTWKIKKISFPVSSRRFITVFSKARITHFTFRMIPCRKHTYFPGLIFNIVIRSIFASPKWCLSHSF